MLCIETIPEKNREEESYSMSKVERTIKEINRMDELAARNTWLNCIHPLAKLIVTIFYIAVTVSMSGYRIEGVLLMAVYPTVLFIMGDISFYDSIRRLKLILPLVCMTGRRSWFAS